MDQLYIESGYYDQGYFVYTAEAESSPTVIAAISCDVGKIANSFADLTATFSQVSTISHTQGADLFAMSEAELAALAKRFRDNNIIADSVFDIGVDYIRVIQGLINVDADTALSADGAITFNAASVIEAAFSISIQEEKIVSVSADFNSVTEIETVGDKVVVADGAFNSEFNIDVSAGLLKEFVIATESMASTLTIAIKVGSIIVDSSSEFVLAATITGTLEAESNINSEFTQLTISDGRINAEANINSEFLQITAAEVSRSLNIDLTDAVVLDISSIKITDIDLNLDVESNLIADIQKIVTFESNQSAEFTQTTTEDLFKSFGSDMSSDFVQLSTVEKIVNGIVDLQTSTDIFCTISHIEGADIVADSFASMSVVADKLSSNLIHLDSVSDLAVDISILRDAIISQSAEFTQTSTEDLFKAFDSALTSTVELDITAAKTAWAESSIDSEFNLDCTISHIEGADIVADSFADLDIEFFVGRVGSGDLQAETEITVANERIRDHDSSQATEASIFAEILRLRDFSSDLTADTVQTAAVNAILSADSSSISSTELFCIISHIEGADIVADSFAELEITANIIKGVSSDLIAEATLDTQAMVMVGLTSDQTATATVTADAMVMFSGFIETESQFTLSALGGILGSLSADLVASGGLLAVGRDIRLDTKVYVIPPETRIYSIAAETRIDSIDSETRIYTIRSTR